MRSSGQMNVLLVEDDAHRLEGHRPTQVVQLANGLAAAGHSVTVCVSSNIAPAGGIPLVEGVSVAAYPHRLQQAQAAIERTRARFPALWGIMMAPAQLVLVTAVRIQLRRDKRRAVVIELSMNGDPIYRALFAPLRTHWAVYRFSAPGIRRSLRLQWLPRAVEMLRRRAGGSVRIVANNRSVLEGWESAAPWLESAIAPIAMIDDAYASGTCEPIHGLGGNRTAGNSNTEGKRAPVALVFGEARRTKDLQTVIEAYEGPGAPGRLVLAGAGVDVEVEKFKATHPDAELSAVSTVDGYLDADTKRSVFAEADIAVVSFVPEVSNDSGTLCDAVVYGLPVCCSEPGAAAAEVVEYGLGLVFPSGDALRLRDAVNALRSGGLVRADGVNRFRSDRRASSVAGSLLRAAFGSLQEA